MEEHQGLVTDKSWERRKGGNKDGPWLFVPAPFRQVMDGTPGGVHTGLQTQGEGRVGGRRRSYCPVSDKEGKDLAGTLSTNLEMDSLNETRFRVPGRAEGLFHVWVRALHPQTQAGGDSEPAPTPAISASLGPAWRKGLRAAVSHCCPGSALLVRRKDGSAAPEPGNEVLA